MATVVLLHDGITADLPAASSLAAGLEKRLIAHLAFPLTVTAVSLAAGPTLTAALAGSGNVALAVPLEPLWSRPTIQRYRDALAAAGHPAVEVVGGWQDDERLRRAVADRARAELGGGRFDDTAVLFLADPLPKRGGSEYHDLAQRAAARLVGVMAPGDWRLAFWRAAVPDPQSGAEPAATPPPELGALLEWEWPTVLAVSLARILPRETDAGLDACLAPVVEQAGRVYRRAPAIAAHPGVLAALADAVVDHLARRPLPDAGGGR